MFTVLNLIYLHRINADAEHDELQESLLDYSNN